VWLLTRARARAAPAPPPADGPAGRQPAGLAANSTPVEVLRQRAHGAKLEIAGKDRANRFALGRDHEYLLVHRRIAKRDRAADPNALALGGSDLVAHPLPDQLPFELGKGQQHIEREPPHAGAGVERLRHGYERDAVGIKQLDELGKVSQRAGQPVDLVNQHDVDLAGTNIGQQPLQRRALKRGARECAIIVAAGDQPPAFVRLTPYVGLTGLALGIERVECKFKIVLGRLARIDGAAGELDNGCVHGGREPWCARDGSWPERAAGTAVLRRRHETRQVEITFPVGNARPTPMGATLFARKEMRWSMLSRGES